MSLDNAFQSIQSISNVALTGTASVAKLANDLGGRNSADWRARLKPAKFRGQEFAVLEGQVRFGRKTAIHQYPFRDGVWVEDLGRSGKQISFSGFIVGDDVIARRANIIRVCEDAGAVEGAELVHPTLGNINVALVGEVTCVERWDRGRVFELGFNFVEQGRRRFPGASIAPRDEVGEAADSVKSAATASFIKSALASVLAGAAVAAQIINTVATWSRAVQRIVNDATNLFHLVQSLPGEFGRMFGGHGQRPVIAGATIPALMAMGAANRSKVGAATGQLAIAVQALSQLPGGLTNPETVNLQTGNVAVATGNVATAAASTLPATSGALQLVDTLLASVAALPGGAPSVRAAPAIGRPATTAQAVARLNLATADLLRRSVLVESALLARQYRPTSYDDATAMAKQVIARVDAEIIIAGDQAEDDLYSSLRTLRAAVLQDMTARGANLAPMIHVATPLPMPALALAQRQYRDGGRVDDVISNGNPVHPAFMPTRMTLLSQ